MCVLPILPPLSIGITAMASYRRKVSYGQSGMYLHKARLPIDALPAEETPKLDDQF